MKTFLEFTNAELSAGTFACLVPTPETATALEAWVKRGLLSEAVQSADDFHLTLIYSPRPVPEAYAYDKRAVNIKATPKCLSNFDNHLVLEVTCEGAIELNDIFTFMGAIKTHDSYKPHVTLVSSLDTTKFDSSKLDLSECPALEFSSIKVSPLNP